MSYTTLCILLIILAAILFLKELREHRDRSNVEKVYNQEKADQIIDYLNAQERLIKEMNGRIDCLGDVVDILVKMQDQNEVARKNFVK